MTFTLPRILILILVVSLPALTAVLFTPALPLITEAFQISETIAPWTMTIFLIGYALGQLPYGPLANRFGRKKALSIGVVLALVGSLVCFFSNHFWFLVLGRLIQAVGSGAGLKITFTMIADRHVGAAATKAYSWVMLAFAGIPGIGMAIGGFLTDSFGWQGCFAFLSLYSLLLLFLIRYLPETAHSFNEQALQFDKIVHAIGRQFKDTFLVWHGILMGFTVAIPYILATVAPYLVIDQMGLSPHQYGLWALVPSIGMYLGLIVTGQISHRVTPRVAILSGIILSMIGVIVLGRLFGYEFFIPLSLFLPMTIIQGGGAITYTFAMSKGLSESTDKSNASAVIQCINMSIVTLGTLLAGFFMPISAPSLAMIFAALVILQLAAWLLLKAHHTLNLSN